MNAPRRPLFEKLAARLARADRFLITTHRNPDPDGLGAELALQYLLRKQGKDALIYNHDPLMSRLGFLDEEKQTRSSQDAFEPGALEGRTVVMVDNSDLARAGDAGRLVLPDLSNLVVIDHHDGMHGAVDVHFLSADCGSTSEMVFELLEMHSIPIPLPIARALYAGIVIDTGHFRYRKTRPRTHQIAARLLEIGVAPDQMADRLLGSWPTARLRGRAFLYQHMHVDQEDGVAWFAIRKSELIDAGCTGDDIEGLVNELLEPDEIEAAILFTEREAGVTRVSARSKGDVDLLPASGKYGGGGHKNACGATIPLDLEPAVEEFIPAVAACVRSARAATSRSAP
ncbi:MAG: bifunctional oligoribonuclease/PAP phosphatase NrnA [Leptospirales bacterium]|nr:bifunctional oligoribonuclease/PAP phosphatase NrnA [Leptospirales bacterium]